MLPQVPIAGATDIEAHVWHFAIHGWLRQIIEQHFPRDLARWPLVNGGVSFEVAALADGWRILVMRPSRASGHVGHGWQGSPVPPELQPLKLRTRRAVPSLQEHALTWWLAAKRALPIRQIDAVLAIPPATGAFAVSEDDRLTWIAALLLLTVDDHAALLGAVSGTFKPVIPRVPSPPPSETALSRPRQSRRSIREARIASLQALLIAGESMLLPEAELARRMGAPRSSVRRLMASPPTPALRMLMERRATEMEEGREMRMPARDLRVSPASIRRARVGELRRDDTES